MFYYLITFIVGNWATGKSVENRRKIRNWHCKTVLY